MLGWAFFIGGFIRWLLKGCKTNLRDEINGADNSITGIDADIESYVLAVIFVLTIFGTAAMILPLFQQ